MREDVKVDLSDSAYDFMNTVYPKLVELNFISGEIISVEGNANDYLKALLDKQASIDVLLVKTNTGVIGIASRVQWYEPTKPRGFPFNSFTIRMHRATGARTEYEKLTNALSANGKYFYPYYTCQSYITERRTGELVSLAIAKTEDIYRIINLGYSKSMVNSFDNNTFEVVYWDVMQSHKCDIKIWVKNTIK